MGVTQTLANAWHEVAVMRRLFPPLDGMDEYRGTLRRITASSNDLLLRVVEDLSRVYSDGEVCSWDAAAVERSRQDVLSEFIAERERVRVPQPGGSARGAGGHIRDRSRRHAEPVVA